MFGKNTPWLSSFRNLTLFGNVTLIETMSYPIACLSKLIKKEKNKIEK